MSTTNHNQQTKPATESGLSDALQNIRKRMLSVGAIAAVGWVILAVIVVLLVAVWLDLLWELPSGARTGASIVAAVVGLVLLLGFAWSLLRNSGKRRLAERLDKVGGTGGEITSGLELADGDGSTFATGNRTSAAAKSELELRHGLAQIAVEKAGVRAAAVDPAVAVPTGPIKTVALALGGILLLVGVIGFAMPKLAKTQWTRFASPSVDVPAFTTIEFDVSPGDVEIKHGQPIDVIVKLAEAPLDDLQLIVHGESTDIIPMFPEGNNQWRGTLIRVTEPIEYQAQTGRAKSKRFAVSLISVPDINDVQIRVTPPEYTRMGTVIASDNDAIQGLKGTKVEVIATSNMPLEGGQLVITGQEGAKTIELTSIKGSDTSVKGDFEIEAGGKFELKVTNTTGIESSQSVGGSVVLLKDDRPFVRMTSPKQSSWATPTVNLPVAFNAEDDFGISDVRLFRSLNNSRPLPLKIGLKDGARMVRDRLFLPLAAYDLKPGDVLDLFARVEDNDPVSLKGAESPVHSIHIISREQYEKMNREQLGVEAVLSKYRQIQRRLEGLEEMQRQLAMMDDDGTDETPKARAAKKQKALEVSNEFKSAAKEMQKLVERSSPVDFDQDLQQRINEMSDQIYEIGREIIELEKAYENHEIDTEEFNEGLKKLREKLEGIRDEFQEQVMGPLGELAKVFELMKKYEMFVQLVLRQRNLADRIRSFDGLDDVEKPDVKRRMRELSDEQKDLQTRLDNLLLDIENDAIGLPAGPDFDSLKESAIEFAGKVFDSGAMDEQTAAATDIAQFSGSDGYKHAERAAKLLERLQEDAEQYENEAEDGMAKAFGKAGRPKLGRSLRQLMNMFGPKNGARGRGPNNRGLYGDQAQKKRKKSSGKGEDSRGGGGMYEGSPDGDENRGEEIKRDLSKGGGSEAAVPMRYQRKVNEYYRRIVEELEE